MSHDGRRLLYTHERAAFLLRARSDLAALAAEHQAELASLRAEVDELREVLLLVTTTLRQQAEADVAALRRRLETMRARIEPRDPAKPLH